MQLHQLHTKKIHNHTQSYTTLPNNLIKFNTCIKIQLHIYNILYYLLQCVTKSTHFLMQYKFQC